MLLGKKVSQMLCMDKLKFFLSDVEHNILFCGDSYSENDGDLAN